MAQEQRALIIIALVIVGVFMLANGYQPYSFGLDSHWLNGNCSQRGGCIHAHWLAIGASALVAAFLIWRR
jgi:hypothetical protein